MARSIARTETALPPSFGSKAALRAALLARRQCYVAGDYGTATANPRGDIPSRSMPQAGAPSGADSTHDGRFDALAERIRDEVRATHTRSLGFYWPLPGEFDARALVGEWLREPSHCAALPVVTDPAGPLAFHRWTPATPMRAGRYGIPVPEQAIDTIEDANHDAGEDGARTKPAGKSSVTTIVIPTVLLIPCVGFDAARYRLGYGGGFYDRTLAALQPRPFTIGIAYECLRTESLPREPHDLPLDVILTESARYA